jgi:hypothetical protein
VLTPLPLDPSFYTSTTLSRSLFYPLRILPELICSALFVFPDLREWFELEGKWGSHPDDLGEKEEKKRMKEEEKRKLMAREEEV